MTTINTNLAALTAQANVRNNQGIVNEVSGRLSSGSRIVKASDDVAGLSIGTVLRTNANSLRTAFSNTQQADSLLSVADGGLSNITQILQRQKSLSIQANAGTLSDTERGFLNQEFQNLTEEIDRLVENTKFNAVTLLDGSLSKATGIVSDVTDGSTTTVGGADILTGIDAVNLAAGDTISVNGYTIELTDQAKGTDGAAGKITIGAGATADQDTAQNIIEFLNNSSDARVANLFFEEGAGTDAVAVSFAGGTSAGAVDVEVSVSLAAPAGATAVNASLDGSVGTAAEGLGIDRLKVKGEYNPLAPASGNAIFVAGDGVDLSGIEGSDTANFLGSGILENIEVYNVAAGDELRFRLEVDGITYEGQGDVVTGGEITLTGRDAVNPNAGGSFALNISTAAFAAGDADTDAEADAIQTQLRDAFKNLEVVQTRDIASFDDNNIGNSGIVEVAGAEVGNLNGVEFDLTAGDFSNLEVEGVNIIAPVNGQVDATIEVVINGDTFTSVGDIGNQIATNTIIGLQSSSDPSKQLSLVTGATAIAGGGTVALDLSTQDNANAVAKAFETAFGIDEGSAKIEFQTGASVTDTIGVEISGLSSSSLFGGLELDISTAAGAQEASAVLDQAINTVVSVRAEVGALQSRFEFAGANLETSIQNQEAATSVFLDADISEESTNFASSQVRLQASISILAQSNQLPQSLLQLIQ